LSVLVLDAEQVRAGLPMATCSELMSRAMVEVSARRAILPLRWGMPLPDDGLLGLMPGALQTPPCHGVKVINIMPGNAGTKLSSHLGTLLLFAADTGLPLAAIDAAELTALRTAAASAMATQHLARADSRVLTLIGTGEQARNHLQALRLVRNFSEIRICSGRMERAEAFIAEWGDCESRFVPCDDVAASVEGADVVCTLTARTEPFIYPAMLAPGAHVNLVGASVPEFQEADADMVFGSRFFVDYLPAASAQAGEVVAALARSADCSCPVAGEIGEVIAGEKTGRETAEQVTVYRSLGSAAQDLMAAWYLFEKFSA
jgi:ornithine cyclodeaminase